MNDVALAIMAKRPTAGQTKTRLSPPLAPHEAAALYEAMLMDTIDLVARLEGVQLVIAYSPIGALDYFRHICPLGAILLPITGADIGDCLHQVLELLLALGYAAVLALNSDGPSLPLSCLQQAVIELRESETDIVLGPNEDGGYYVIGLKEPHPKLFQGIDWSTKWVTTQAAAKAEMLGLRLSRLPLWYDVDTAAELARLRAELPTLAHDALPHTRRVLSALQRAKNAERTTEGELEQT
jgi:hypothetical protein